MTEAVHHLDPLSAPTGEFARHGRTLVGCMLAAGVGVIGLNAYTSGSFVPALVKSAGYTREQISLATLLLSAVVAIAAPFVGQAVDRWGASRVIALSVVGEALGFALLACAPARFAWFSAGMMILALLGAGTTPPGFSRIVASRFDARRGLALGVMISGVGVTAIFAPLIMTPIIAAVGWRGGYWTLCGAVFALGGLGLRLIGRDEPRPLLSASGAAASDGGGWGALRRPLFAFVLVCFAGPALFGGGFLLHLISILKGRGFTQSQAAQVQALVGVAIVAGRLSSGFLMDRVFAGYVAAAAFVLSAIGTFLLLSHVGALLCLAALFIGLTIGAELDILALTLSRYFGLASFGRLYGLAYSTMILAGGASPFLIARLSRSGDYTPAIVVCGAGLAIAAVFVALLPKFGAHPRGA